MNYVSTLTGEEKAILCKIVTGKGFKELFKKNEQEFSRIKGGFRAKSLKEQSALSIAIQNIDKPFIATWVNALVEHWLDEIQENIEKLENEGLPHNAALATTMLDSVFANHVELYFKLIEKPLSPDVYADLCVQMENSRGERTKNAESADRISALEEENRNLSDQVANAKRSIDAIENECDDRVKKAEQDKNRLTSLLAEAQTKITELQTAPSTFENNDADYLAQFDDRDTSILPSVGTDEIVSICNVKTDYTGQKKLIRCADLGLDGQYHVFRKDDSVSDVFMNWYRINHKDGPSNEGFYGTWTWYPIPNDRDSSKKFISSKYNPRISPIAVYIVTETESIDDLLNLLKRGIEYQPHSRRVMFVTYTSKGEYVGVLCAEKDLNTSNGITNISEDCISVPVYEFTGDDIVNLDNGVLFYRNAFAGIPSRLYHLKSPLEVVKSIVFSSISWNTYKAIGATRANFGKLKDFIGAIPVEDIICKIGAECRCSNPAAKELLDEFLTIVWKYVDGDSLEDSIILSAISANPELQEKAKALVRGDWETENECLLTKARDDLNALHAELKSVTANLNEAQEELNRIKTEDERFAGIIAEREKMAADVEKAVAKRIQKASENVAEFIASMAFVGKQELGVSERGTSTYFICPAFENLDVLETHHSWTEVVDTVAFELGEAGVAEERRRGLAAFLCAAYIEKQPLLLVGPNAVDIMQAFSAAVTAHKHGVLYCDGSYTAQATKKIGSDGEDIVIIKNLLSSGCMDNLPEILSQKDIFYVAIHPYAEDVQVEPKSLYGFMLPLFTEFFVDKRATGQYYGGYFANGFEKYSAPKEKHRDQNIFSEFALSALVRKQLSNLLATMHGIYSDTTKDDEFLFAVLPIAYALLETNRLNEMIGDLQKDIAISADLRRSLQYILGDI